MGISYEVGSVNFSHENIWASADRNAPQGNPRGVGWRLILVSVCGGFWCGFKAFSPEKNIMKLHCDREQTFDICLFYLDVVWM